MKFNKKVLVIHAHPDDTEAFCAGTLKLLKDRGYGITIATMTAGGMGGINMTPEETIRVRKAEAKKAAEVLGASYLCLDRKDGYLFDDAEIRVKTTELIRREEAGTIITHLPFDYHSDHRTTAGIVEAAAMLATLPNVPTSVPPLEVTPLLYHTEPLGYSDPLGGEPTSPQFFIDISSTIDIKMEMLTHHVSQIDLMRVMHKMENFFEEMKKNDIHMGELAGTEYAEAFWQHLGGGYQKDPLLQEELKDFVIMGDKA